MTTIENTITIPPRVLRLASQLGLDPETLASTILHHGAGVIDWNLSAGVRAMEFSPLDPDYDLPAAMDALSPVEIQDLTTDTDEPQYALYDRHLATTGKKPR